MRKEPPALVAPPQIEILDGRFGAKSVAALLGGRGVGLHFEASRDAVRV